MLPVSKTPLEGLLWGDEKLMKMHLYSKCFMFIWWKHTQSYQAGSQALHLNKMKATFQIKFNAVKTATNRKQPLDYLQSVVELNSGPPMKNPAGYLSEIWT